MRGRELPEVVPEGVDGDVLDDDHPVLGGGGPARARPGTDPQPVDRVREAGRNTRRDERVQRPALPVEHEHGRDRAVRVLLDELDEQAEHAHGPRSGRRLREQLALHLEQGQRPLRLAPRSGSVRRRAAADSASWHYSPTIALRGRLRVTRTGDPATPWAGDSRASVVPP